MANEFILACDGYKLSHRVQYPSGTQYVYSNLTARSSRIEGADSCVFFGLQSTLKRDFIDLANRTFFSRPKSDVLYDYQKFTDNYLGPGLSVDHIAALHDLEYIPLEFRALPEGTHVPLRVPMFTVENTHPDFFWVTNYFETLLSSRIWQACRSASVAFRYRQLLETYAQVTGGPQAFVDWQGHDFSFRGMPSPEAAALSGAGHLLSFTGTDTIPAIQLLHDDYDGEGLIGGSVPACYDQDTEILTSSGFKLFSDLSRDDKVAQYRKDGSINFVVPDSITKEWYYGPMECFTSGPYKYVDLKVTPNHKIVSLGDDGLELKEAQHDKPFARGKHAKMPVAGMAVGDGSMECLTDVDRLEIAFQADGSFASNPHRYTGSRIGTTPIRFTLKKERKKERLRAILSRLGWSFTETESESRTGYSNFWINSQETFHKTFDWIDLSSISSRWAQDFIEEVSHWDACIHTNSIQYSSCIKSNTEIIQAIAILAGYRTHLSDYKDHRSTRQLQYIVSITRNRNSVSCENLKKEAVGYQGYVYCVSVSSKMVVVRRNGVVAICGNTEHSVMCAGGDLQEIQTFRRLMKIYPRGILSVVSDTWNLWLVLDTILPLLKEEIMSRDGKLVIRPDSGDPVLILTGDVSQEPGTPAHKGVIQMLWDLFGGTHNSKGFKELDSHIGAIYGDSITLSRAGEICGRLKDKGFASTNVVYGIGSFTYQYGTRDDYGMAMKATWAKINSKEHFLYKDPATDTGGKKSAMGRLVVVEEHGSLKLVDKLGFDEWRNRRDDLLQPVWRDGRFLNRTNLAEIRSRIRT